MKCEKYHKLSETRLDGREQDICFVFKLLSNEKCRLFTVNMTLSSVNRTMATVERKLTSATIKVTDELTIEEILFKTQKSPTLTLLPPENCASCV